MPVFDDNPSLSDVHPSSSADPSHLAHVHMTKSFMWAQQIRKEHTYLLSQIENLQKSHDDARASHEQCKHTSAAVHRVKEDMHALGKRVDSVQSSLDDVERSAAISSELISAGQQSIDKLETELVKTAKGMSEHTRTLEENQKRDREAMMVMKEQMTKLQECVNGIEKHIVQGPIPTSLRPISTVPLPLATVSSLGAPLPLTQMHNGLASSGLPLPQSSVPAATFDTVALSSMAYASAPEIHASIPRQLSESPPLSSLAQSRQMVDKLADKTADNTFDSQATTVAELGSPPAGQGSGANKWNAAGRIEVMSPVLPPTPTILQQTSSVVQHTSPLAQKTRTARVRLIVDEDAPPSTVLVPDSIEAFEGMSLPVDEVPAAQKDTIVLDIKPEKMAASKKRKSAPLQR